MSVLFAACGGGNATQEPEDNAGAGGGATTDGGGTTAEGSYYDRAMAKEFDGKTVTMMGPFTDEDAVKFEQSIDEFEQATGIDIQYEGSKEFEATIAIRVNGGSAPDIADFPQPGLVANFVRDGKVLDASQFLDMNWLQQNYNQSWLDMSMMDAADGKEIMAGVWHRVNAKSLVWYPKREFEEAGYEIPETWDDLIALSNQMVEDGVAPWCIGIESGAATGWPATDWLEEVMLRTTSLENYDKWVTGELPFTDPVVKNAVEKMSEIWLNEDYVYGGRKAIVTTNFGDAAKPLFNSPPDCFLHKQGNFITSFFPEGLTANEDYGFFYLPPIDEQYGKPVLVAGDLMVAFNDRPEVRAVMDFFTRGESVINWLASGGAISPHKDTPLDAYTNDVDRGIAEIIINADSARFDGSDLMPGAVGAGTFWKGMTDYISGTVDLDAALQEIQNGWSTVQ
ncbi:ABC transporter substrate-binding protein [Paenibacillus sp. TRM 82003]|nr:ABC transporter substrate-binding protein [Paenibacillus sp. TRM 82003]MCI3923478.1 ABC transporter substrate-binding protein [Paenibacillus sp. TRM 82003]